jgi:hypothetical protein
MIETATNVEGTVVVAKNNFGNVPYPFHTECIHTLVDVDGWIVLQSFICSFPKISAGRAYEFGS